MEVRVFFGENLVAVHRITGKAKIGRSKECEIKLVHPEVSFVHAEVYESNGVWFIRDMGSRNGTFINGQRIAEGESVKLGESDILIHPYRLKIKEESTLVESLETVFRKKDEVLLVVGRERKEIELPYRGKNFSVEREGGWVYFIGQNGRRKRVKGHLKLLNENLEIFLPGYVLTSSRWMWKVAYFFLGVLIGLLLFQPENRERLTADSLTVEPFYVVDNYENEVKELIEKRDWAGARAKMMELMAEGKDFPLMEAYMRTTYEEERWERVIEEAETMAKKRKFERALTLLSTIPENSVYYARARHFMEEIERKQMAKRKKQYVPVYLKLYLKGNVAEAIENLDNPKLQVAISSVFSLLEKAEEVLRASKYEEAFATSTRVLELDSRISKGKGGVVRNRAERVRRESLAEIIEDSIAKREYIKAMKYLKIALNDYSKDHTFIRFKKHLNKICQDMYLHAYSVSELSRENALNILKDAEVICAYEATTLTKVKALIEDIERR